MMRTLIAVGLVVVGLTMVVPLASACPMCKEAIPAPGDGSGTLNPEEQEGVQTAKAYNASILTFVAMPYLLVGTVGFLVYRSYKARAAKAPTGSE